MAASRPLPLAGTAKILSERIPQSGANETDTDNARHVLGQAGQICTKIAEACDKINADVDTSDLGKAKQRAKTISLYAEPVLEDLLKAQARIKEQSARTVSIINSLPEMTADEKALGAEIRNHCKTLPTLSDRIKLLSQADKSGDMLTIRSLLDGPGYLTGLSPQIIEITRTDLQESLSPSATVQRGRLDETLNILNIMTEGMQKLVIENKAAAA
jgi:hypothetical protein